MRGPTILKETDDKTRQLSDHTIMAYSGEAGDTVKFAEFIQANIALYTTRNSHTLTPSAIAAFTRSELAHSLRSRSPYNVNLLLGGIDLTSSTTTSATASTTSQPADAEPVPKLFWLDYLASMAEVPYAAHGYAQYYCLSLLDKHHHPEMSLEAGLKVLKMCADELKKRLPIDFKGLLVRVCTREGVKVVEMEGEKGVS